MCLCVCVCCLREGDDSCHKLAVGLYGPDGWLISCYISPQARYVHVQIIIAVCRCVLSPYMCAYLIAFP